MHTSAPIRTYKTSRRVVDGLADPNLRSCHFSGDAFNLLKAMPDESVDLIFSSPPYCMGKEYESTSSVVDFEKVHKELAPQLARVLRVGGSICWQVGYHSGNNQLTPLDFLAHQAFSLIPGLRLRNRVIWTFAHGLHASKRFSGRHETVLWYTKGDGTHFFNLDAVRVPQKYPGKRSYKGPNKGQLSGNPLGKNPGDVWEFPNVKGGHVEKTGHPCQFPVALPQRFIRALCAPGSLVFDPFMGVGSTGVAAMLEGSRFVGSDIQLSYIKIAESRIRDAIEGRARYRPLDRPIEEPRPTYAVARRPDHFRG